LLINFIYCENFFNTTDIVFSNYSVVSLSSLEIKTTCNTLADCSENAIECKNNGTNTTNSYCVYPNYICSNAESCYKINVENTLNKDLLIEQNYNKNIFNCTYDDECQSNQCVSGQCLITSNSTIFYCNIEDTNFKCVNLIGEKCSSDADCITSNCDENSKTCIKKEETPKKTSTTIYVVIIISIVVGFIMFLIILWAFYECFQYMDENPEIKDFREKNKAGAGVGVIIALSGVC